MKQLNYMVKDWTAISAALPENALLRMSIEAYVRHYWKNPAPEGEYSRLRVPMKPAFDRQRVLRTAEKIGIAANEGDKS